MKRNILFLFFYFGLFIQSFAQVEVPKYETIKLSDGSIIEGYLKFQNLSKDKSNKFQTIEIYAQRIERVIPDSLILGAISNTTYSLDQVEISWRNWFEEHQKFIEKKDGKEYVTLNHFEIRNSQKMPWGTFPGKVKVLEMGEFVKYVEFPNAIISLDAKMISKIIYPSYNDDVLTGIEETIYTRDNRTYSGYLSYLVPSKILGLFLTNSSNQTVNISFSDIQKRIKKGKNIAQSLMEQSLFLDIIETIDGRTIRGIITGYDYGNKKESPCLTIAHSNTFEHIFLQNIRNLSREENKDFYAIKNVQVKGSDIILNDKSLKFKKPVRFNEDNIVLKDDSLDVTLKKSELEGKLVIYLNEVKENKNISLIRLNQKDYKKKELKTIPELENSDIVKGNGTSSMLVFGYEDIVRRNLNFEEETYPNGVKKRSYDITPGYYILYRPYNEDLVLINLK